MAGASGRYAHVESPENDLNPFNSTVSGSTVILHNLDGSMFKDGFESDPE